MYLYESFRNDKYFDIRVTNPIYTTAMKRSLGSVYDVTQMKKKKRQYSHRVITVEKETFTPRPWYFLFLEPQHQSVKRFSDHRSPK